MNLDVSGEVQWRTEDCLVSHCLEGKYRPIFPIRIGGRQKGKSTDWKGALAKSARFTTGWFVPLLLIRRSGHR